MQSNWMVSNLHDKEIKQSFAAALQAVEKKGKKMSPTKTDTLIKFGNEKVLSRKLMLLERYGNFLTQTQMRKHADAIYIKAHLCNLSRAGIVTQCVFR